MTTSDEAEKRFSDWQELQRDKIRNQDGQLQSVIVLLPHPTLDSAITRIQSAEIGESALTDWLPHLGGNAMTP
jgi:hypothetical protein